MPLVPCKCTNCGAALEIDNNLEAAICRFCGTPFIVEKAINYYKTVNITMEAKDDKAMILKGKRMVADVNFDEDELSKLASTLSDLTQNEFYPEFFAFASGDKYNDEWLLKNAKGEERLELAKFLFIMITRDYRKQSFDDVNLHIAKNYSNMLFDNIGNDKTYRAVMMLSKLTDTFDDDCNKKWNKLKEMAEKELNDSSNNIEDISEAQGLLGYALSFTPIVKPETKDLVINKVKAYTKSKSNLDFLALYKIAKQLDSNDLFEIKLADNATLKYKTFKVNGIEFNNDQLLSYIIDDVTGTTEYLLIKLSDTTATVARLENIVRNYKYYMVFDNAKEKSLSFFDKLVEYKSEEIEGYPYKLIYKEGLSYKKTAASGFLGKIFGFFK